MPDKQTSDLSRVKQKAAPFSNYYSNNVWLQALWSLATTLPWPFPLAPALAAAKEYMDAGVVQLQLERRRVFFDELVNGNILLTQELIGQEDFLHAFTCTWQAALNTKNRTKIKMFARIFTTGVNQDRLNDDSLEEYTSILDDLSPRELTILLTLKKFEDKCRDISNSKLEVDIDCTSEFWDKFMSEVMRENRISVDVLNAMLIRLTRTGLYTIFTGYLNSVKSQGHLTELFHDFANWITHEYQDVSSTDDISEGIDNK